MSCALCGTPGGIRNTVVTNGGVLVCHDCLDSLVDNEIEKRGEREDARRLAEYNSGAPTQQDRDNQDLRDAGRGHLAR